MTWDVCPDVNHRVNSSASLCSPSPPWWSSRRCRSTWFTNLLRVTSVWTWTSGSQDARTSATTSTPRRLTLLAHPGWGTWVRQKILPPVTFYCKSVRLLDFTPSVASFLLNFHVHLVLLSCSCRSILIWKWRLEGMDREYWRYSHFLLSQHKAEGFYHYTSFFLSPCLSLTASCSLTWRLWRITTSCTTWMRKYPAITSSSASPLMNPAVKSLRLHATMSHDSRYRPLRYPY